MYKRLIIFIIFCVLSGCKKSEDGTVEVIPLAPTELKGTIISKDQVDLTWKDNSTNETGYKIERKTDSGNFTEIGSTATDVTIFSDKTVSLNTNYSYRVYSFNKVGKSIQYSNEVSIKTINLPTLTTYQISAITFTLNGSNVNASSGGGITSDGGSAVTANGVVWDTSTNPTISLSTKTSDGTGNGAFKSSITGLKATTKYYVRAYATNAAGTGYGNELSFTTGAYIIAPTLTTNTISDILSNSVKSGGNISADGGAAVTSRGVVWGTATNPGTDLSTKTSDGTGTGSFQSSITGLKENTKYYLRAYAINSNWIGYGNEVSFTTPAAVSPSFNTVVGANGKIWMDRNLGATQVATWSGDAESFGDLYQWGRGTDGHQKRTSAIKQIQNSSDVPGHGNFIVNLNTLDDWRSPQNNNLWQGVSGINNPCPSGFRIPTYTELENERKSWIYSNKEGPFASALKLPAAGWRQNEVNSSVALTGAGDGYYWSSTVNGIYSIGITFWSKGTMFFPKASRAYGFSVRCIKD
jgi:uncharacterized protein (TIGR02145 family)